MTINKITTAIIFIVTILTSACQTANPSSSGSTQTSGQNLGLSPTPVSSPDPNSPMMIATVVSQSSGPRLVQRDFNEAGTSLGNVVKGDWTSKTVDGNGLLEVLSPPSGGPGNLPTVAFGSPTWTNYLFGFRFKVTECIPKGYFGCVIVITFRNEEDQAYVAMINTDKGQVLLNFGGHDGWTEFDNGISDSYLDVPLGTWHDVIIVVDREKISISVDGVWTSEVSDDRLKTGGVGIEVGPGMTMQLDDLNAWNIP